MVELDGRRLQFLELLLVRPRGNKELAFESGMSSASVSRVANDLMRRGFVSRTINPHNLRSVTFALTERGRAYQLAARGLISLLEDTNPNVTLRSDTAA